jgi:RNA polymerase sigma factor (sigma-70 family)
MQLSKIIPGRQSASAVRPTTDGSLLGQFSKSGEEGPFAQLISRHGAAVYGFSRRLVNHVEDAEDIYQAAFLVLARKARSLAYRQSILGWLLQVVRKLAADVRRAERRRLRYEKRVPESASPVTASLLAESREAARLLVEELSKLPPKLREPLLLCYWEGLSKPEAARRLHWPEGTVSGRLFRGKALLRTRLQRRGLLPTVATALTGGAVVSQAATRSIDFASIKMAFVHSGKLASLVPLGTFSLYRGALISMWLNKAKIAVAGLSVIAALSWAGFGLLGTSEAHAALVGSVVLPEPIQNVAASGVDRKEVRKAIDRAVQFLKSKQLPNGSWDTGTVPIALGDYAGGCTGLVCLAMLLADQDLSNENLAKGLENLRSLKMTKNYCIALRVTTLAKALSRQKPEIREKDQQILRADCDELLRNVVRDKKMRGWSYPVGPPGVSRADFSNTHFAVLALDAGEASGVAIPRAVWQEVRDLYLENQMANGGWGYYPNTEAGGTRLTMSLAGIYGLSVGSSHLKEQPPEKALSAAVRFVERQFDPKDLAVADTKNLFSGSAFPYYTLFTLGHAAHAAKIKQLHDKNGKLCDWYDEVAKRLLEKQRVGGSWESRSSLIDGDPIIATSFCIIFLAGWR